MVGVCCCADMFLCCEQAVKTNLPLGQNKPYLSICIGIRVQTFIADDQQLCIVSMNSTFKQDTHCSYHRWHSCVVFLQRGGPCASEAFCVC